MKYPQDIAKWRKITVYDEDFRPELIDMANAISKSELWDWMKNESCPEGQGYMYWGHKNISIIENNLTYNPHSGASFGYCMRQMQFIAKNGFEEWNK